MKDTSMPLPTQCTPCHKGATKLTHAEITHYMQELSAGWQLVQQHCAIEKRFNFKNFSQALDFTNKVGAIAEQADHHPEIQLGWGYCVVQFSTHSIGGLHANDFILAKQVDAL